MEELIVEGLEKEDFIVLGKILKTYKVSISDDVSFQDVINLSNKIDQIIKCLED